MKAECVGAVMHPPQASVESKVMISGDVRHGAGCSPRPTGQLPHATSTSPLDAWGKMSFGARLPKPKSHVRRAGWTEKSPGAG